MAKADRLKPYVQKVLLIRLLIAGGLIALVVTISSYILERDRFTRTLAREVANDAALITASRSGLQSIPPEQRTERLQQTMDQVISGLGEQRLQSDHFVLMRFFDQDKILRAESRESGELVYTPLLNALPRRPEVFPDTNDYWYRIETINDRMVVHMVTSLANFEGMDVAWFEGVFALSQASMDAFHARLIRTALIAFAIVLLTLASVYPLVMSLTARLSRLSQNLMEANMETLQVLGSAIAKRDSDTNAHNYRVTIIAVRLAEAIGLGKREIRGLIKGAFLHDVGKIGIRDEILLKPGKLDEDEYAIMKTHVDHGIEIVARSRWLSDAMQVVQGHHEQVSGNGYPQALAGDEIPVAARIFAIVDVFDALTARRPYKEPFSFERTMAILEKDSGTHFDANLVAVFKDIAGDIYANLATREEGLEEKLDQLLQTYFPGGKEDLDDADRL